MTAAGAATTRRYQRYDLPWRRESSVLVHTPDGLSPWARPSRAHVWMAYETFELPKSPRLYSSLPVAEGADSFVSLDADSEPACTSIMR